MLFSVSIRRGVKGSFFRVEISELRLSYLNGTVQLGEILGMKSLCDTLTLEI